jgi:hypothetical protein
MNGPATNTLVEAAASAEPAKPGGNQPPGGTGRRLFFLVLLVPLLTGLLTALDVAGGFVQTVQPTTGFRMATTGLPNG